MLPRYGTSIPLWASKTSARDGVKDHERPCRRGIRVPAGPSAEKDGRQRELDEALDALCDERPASRRRWLSEKPRDHVSRILAELGVRNRTEAAFHAVRAARSP
jgi:hypothetical protein